MKKTKEEIKEKKNKLMELIIDKSEKKLFTDNLWRFNRFEKKFLKDKLNIK